jgi:hypothetical protein
MYISTFPSSFPHLVFFTVVVGLFDYADLNINRQKLEYH